MACSSLCRTAFPTTVYNISRMRTTRGLSPYTQCRSQLCRPPPFPTPKTPIRCITFTCARRAGPLTKVKFWQRDQSGVSGKLQVEHRPLRHFVSQQLLVRGLAMMVRLGISYVAICIACYSTGYFTRWCMSEDACMSVWTGGAVGGDN